MKNDDNANSSETEFFWKIVYANSKEKDQIEKKSRKSHRIKREMEMFFYFSIESQSTAPINGARAYSMEY